MMLKVGQYLQNRYEILSLIGTGGMSEVYQAKCHVLNRLVAIKLLKEEYSTDANFVSRFKMEAQSAAGLSHPNIVSIYDVVDEDSLHYIVMELIEGVTLKNYIRNKGRLENREAIGIAIQVAQGIAAAHDQHIVHRDIKPQNMIINKDGKVKVADFGIARAVSCQTVNGNAVGSVHYISPEQAKGEYSDARSDIYSLGITMFEMVTGKTPFEGDTPVQIALAHLQQPMPHAESLNPEVSTALSRIISRCTQKMPENRYQDCYDLISELRRALVDPEDEQLNRQAESDDAPTQVRGADNDGPTIILDRIADSAESVKRKNAKPAEEKENAGTPEKTGKPAAVHGKPKNGASRGISHEANHHKHKETASLDKMLNAIGIAAAMIIVIIIIVIGVKLSGLFNDSFSDSGKSTEISAGSGTEEAASESESESGSEAESVAEESSSGEIIRLDSLNLVGMTLENAKQVLSDKNLEVKIEEENNTDVEKGKIIRYSPAEAEAGDTVTLTSSLGPEKVMVPVPNITGMSVENAKVVLETIGLSLGMETRTKDDAAAGTILSQSAEPQSEIAKGSSIDYVVSEGRDTHFVAAVNDTLSLQDYFGPSSGNTELKISIVMKQVVDGENHTKVVMDPTTIMANTALPVQYSIEGAEGVRRGTLQVLDLTNDRVLKTYNLTFVEVAK